MHWRQWQPIDEVESSDLAWMYRTLSYPLESASYVVSSWIEQFAGSGGPTLVTLTAHHVWESGLRYEKKRPETLIVWYVFLSIEITIPICTNQRPNFSRWRYQFLRTEAFFFRTKNAWAGSHWQAEVNLANTDLKHFLQQTGPFTALDYPPKNADHDAVALRGSPCRCTMSCYWSGLIRSLEDARRSYGTHFFARLSLQAMDISRLRTFQGIPQSSSWKCCVGSLGRLYW